MSGIFLMVRRSLRQHAFSTAITVLSVALASGLTTSVFSIKSQSADAFTGGEIGFDAVLGARGSQLQLVLNTVFHLETSPGNIPWTLYQAVKNDARVAVAIPYAVGDNYFGYRIVGTTPEIFTDFEYRKGHKFETEAGGAFFDASRREAVVGSIVAQETGIKVGDTINPYHGLRFDPSAKHADEYVVTGVLKPTNSPSDRVIWIPIEGIFRMEGHVLRGADVEGFRAEAGQAIPDEHKEVSAVMLKFRAPTVGFQLDELINKRGKEATLAWPIANVMASFLNKMGWLEQVLGLVAYLTMVVAAGTILASIYNTINERRREFAILRALGARRGTVFSAIVLEAFVITVAGTALGFAVSTAIMAVAAYVVRQQTGVVLDIFSYDRAALLAPLFMIGLGAVSGIVPAVKAYATDVATNLTPST